MNPIAFTPKFRTLSLTSRSNPLGADHLTYGSPTSLGRHLSESLISSIRSTAMDRDVSDLPTYIIVWKNCLRMTSRNSNSRSIRKTEALALHKTLHSLFDFTSSEDLSQVLFDLLHHYDGDKDFADMALYCSSLSVALRKLEDSYKQINPSLNLKQA